MKNLVTLTAREEQMLSAITTGQNELGHSDYTTGNDSSDNKLTNPEKGVLSSLVQKGLVYDSYKEIEDDFQMWCLTPLGYRTALEVGLERHDLSVEPEMWEEYATIK